MRMSPGYAVDLLEALYTVGYGLYSVQCTAVESSWPIALASTRVDGLNPCSTLGPI
jgi:hypothetical protein